MSFLFFSTNPISIITLTVLIFGTSVFFDVNAEVINEHGHPHTLKEQLTEYKSGENIICPNPDHVLVLRPNTEWACVFPETAQYLKWDIVSFPEFEPQKITTQVLRDNKYHNVSYQITEGSVDSLEYDTEMSALLVNLTTTTKGELTMIITTGENGLFRDYCHEVDALPGTEALLVLRDGEEIEFDSSEINTDLINVKLDYLPDSKLIEILYVCWV